MAVTQTNFKIKSIVYISGTSSPTLSNFTVVMFNESGDTLTRPISSPTGITSFTFNSMNTLINSDFVAQQGGGGGES